MSKKKKFNIIKENKKEIIILIILIIMALIAVLFERSYALDEEPMNEPSQTEHEETSTTLLSYAEDSSIKAGNKVKAGDIGKYQVSYTNTSTSSANVKVEITLSDSLKYVPNSSTIGEPNITSNADGTITLSWNKVKEVGESEIFTFEAQVLQDSDCNIEVSGSITINDSSEALLTLTNEAIDITITYTNDNNGTVVGENIETIKYNKSPMGRETNPTEGYVLKGWTSNKKVTLNGGTEINSGALMTSEQIRTIKAVEDITLTAIHELSNNNQTTPEKVTVTYKDGNNVIDDPAPFEVDAGTYITIAPLPEKEGYIAEGWTIDGVPVNTGDRIVISKNTIIQAVYRQSQNTRSSNYRVVYKYNDEVIEETTKTSGQTIILRALPKEDNCEVKGWSINGENFNAGASITISGDTTITAQSLCSVEEVSKSNSSKNITKSEEKSNVIPSSKETTKVANNRYNSKISNPKTGDRIATYILISGISLVVIITLLIILKLKNKDKKEQKEDDKE